MKVDLIYITPNYEGIVYYTYRIQNISRVTLAQLTRHDDDIAYSVQSHRYTSPKNFITPPSMQKLTMDGYTKENLMHYVWDLYDALIDAGIPKEDARYFLPQAVSTNLIMTINARSLRNFFKLRLDKHAQWEIRTLAENMYLKLPKDHKETLFYDINIMED